MLDRVEHEIVEHLRAGAREGHAFRHQRTAQSTAVPITACATLAAVTPSPVDANTPPTRYGNAGGRIALGPPIPVTGDGG